MILSRLKSLFLLYLHCACHTVVLVVCMKSHSCFHSASCPTLAWSRMETDDLLQKHVTVHALGVCAVSTKVFCSPVLCCKVGVTITFFLWGCNVIVLVRGITKQPMGLTIKTIKRSKLKWLLLTLMSSCCVVIDLHIVFSAVLRGRVFIVLLNSSYESFFVLCLPPGSHINMPVSLFWSREAFVLWFIPESAGW